MNMSTFLQYLSSNELGSAILRCINAIDKDDDFKLKSLLTKYPEINEYSVINNASCNNLLHYTATTCAISCSRYLCEQGWSVFKTNYYGITPYQMAERSECLEIWVLLSLYIPINFKSAICTDKTNKITPMTFLMNPKSIVLGGFDENDLLNYRNNEHQMEILLLEMLLANPEYASFKIPEFMIENSSSLCDQYDHYPECYQERHITGILKHFRLHQFLYKTDKNEYYFAPSPLKKICRTAIRRFLVSRLETSYNYVQFIQIIYGNLPQDLIYYLCYHELWPKISGILPITYKPRLNFA